ncbi:MAG TPA: hypothetical protein VNA14_07890 [Mycobacteriales bacterium]|nr:hypothetical protein [Mycobacteriales bacterium]
MTRVVDTLEHGREPGARRTPGPRVVAVGLVVAVVVAAAVLVRTRDDDVDRMGAKPPVTGSPTATSRPPEPSPSPSPRSDLALFLDSLPIGPPLQQRIVVDGQLIDPSNGTDRVLLSVPFTRMLATSTPHGTLLQGHALDGGNPTYHWALMADDDAHPVAQGSGNFGVIRLNADETRAAYTRHDLNGTPDDLTDDVLTVELATFPEMRLLNRAVVPVVDAVAASVAGFVGDRVMLTRGDGADVSTLVWTPGGSFRTADRATWSSTAATDPAGSWAVVNQGDGGCGILVRVGRSVPSPPSGAPTCMRFPAFSADGRLVASYDLALNDHELAMLRVRELPSTRVVAETHLPGPGEAWGEITVVSAREVLVVAADYVGEQRVKYAVLRCQLSETFNPAPCEVAWRSDVERDFSAVTVVQP